MNCFQTANRRLPKRNKVGNNFLARRKAREPARQPQHHPHDTMDALATLRNAISAIHHSCQTPELETSSEPSNISSLSGSLGRTKRSIDEERGRLFDLALDVERCLADLETNHELLQQQQDEMVDLLVECITIPNVLFRKGYKLECAKESLSNMEEICLNIVCISCDCLIQYLGYPDFSFDCHIDTLVEQVISLCEEQHWGIHMLYPIITFFNALADQRKMEELFERRPAGYKFEYDDPPYLLRTSAKDTLRLVQALLRVGESTMDSCQWSHIGLFTSHLLGHFAEMALLETGHSTFEECNGLFCTWANGANEPVARRLTETDTDAILALVSQLQIDSVESALHLIDKSDTLVASFLTDYRMNEEANNKNNVESCLAAIYESMRHVNMAVSMTKVMEKLGMSFDREISNIFHPLIVAFTAFVATGLQEALMSFTLHHDEQGLSYVADDLLLQILHTSIGVDFLKQCDDVKRDEILTVGLLRALNSGYITGKGKFLLELAAEYAKAEQVDFNSKPSFKRRFHVSADKNVLNDSSHRASDMTGVLILCLTLSQSNIDDGIDQTLVEQIASMALSLMPNDQGGTNYALDPLNPWHSLNINPLRELTSTLDNSPEEYANDAITAYSSAIPSCFNTRTANIFL